MLIPDLSSSRRSSPWIGPFRDAFLLAIVMAAFLAFAPADATDAEERRLKIAFEVSSDSALEAFVANIEGLQKNFGELAEITVVASSRGVELFRAQGNGWERRLAKLADQGVDFVACNEGLQELTIEPSDLVAFARIVRSGNQQLIHLTEQGWARVGDGESYVSHL